MSFRIQQLIAFYFTLTGRLGYHPNMTSGESKIDKEFYFGYCNNGYFYGLKYFWALMRG